jgi:hypothetical protein
MIVPMWQKLAAYIEKALLMDAKELQIVQKQYAYIVLTYHRMIKEHEAWLNEKLNEEVEPGQDTDQETETDVTINEKNKDWMSKEMLIARLANDWRMSMASVKEILSPVEYDLFLHRQVSQYEYYDPELRPETSEGFPTDLQIKLKVDAMKTIKMH